ncbi:hypothetical protein [Neobacillus sp. PS3-40]|uniref:hypothetical protein n=1 Tax=Neobacillus sp. PS3-40 TaxID=3070679 RepID=UPI0027DF4E94|nr:hypothetical protein [Neobacillus sp. PS3-40]WML42852.1 hypothetical protein RCG20_13540 [Neobacillus sp. PS3-40]
MFKWKIKYEYVHWVNYIFISRPKIGWATIKRVFINAMKAQTRLGNKKKGLHQGYEGPKSVGQQEKGLS